MCAATLLVICAVASSVLADVDWRKAGWQSAPGDQQGCGGCYGFASVTLLESFTYQITGKKIAFSPQYYVDCFDRNGCAGGSLKETLQNVEEFQYQAYREDYEFTGYYEPEHCLVGGFKNRTARNALADVWLLRTDKIEASDSGLEAALNRGPTANDMVVSSGVFDWQDSPGKPFTDYLCQYDANPHSMAFVGYTKDYWIVKNSYGPDWAGDGYINYARKGNQPCNYNKKAYTIYMSKRKELEYRIGKGRLSFEDAESACEAMGDGWTLAIIPTRMHMYQVFDLFAAAYGTDPKSDPDFNYFWIGIRDALSEDDMMFIDGKTPAVFQWFYSNPIKYKFVKMSRILPKGGAKLRGKWYVESKVTKLRYMCSRFRAEHCERISQTEVTEAEQLLYFTPEGERTLEIRAGTRARVTCMPEYELTGPAEAVCQEDGTWSKLPECLGEEEPTESTKTCPPFHVEHEKYTRIVDEKGNTVENAPGIPEDSRAKLKCKQGYKKKFHKNLCVHGHCHSTYCMDGVWQNVPTCEKNKAKHHEDKTVHR